MFTDNFETTPSLAPTPNLVPSGSSATTLKNNRLGLIYHCIKDLLPCPKDKFANASLAVSFLKSFGEDLLGVTPDSQGTLHGPTIVAKEHQLAFQSLFQSYASDLSQSLVREHKAIQREERINQERYIARGEIHEDTRARFEGHFKAYEKHLQSMQSIAECLTIPMPELPPDNADASLSNIVISDSSLGNYDFDNVFENGPWEDDDARVFYDKILDLKTLVPSILLGNSSAKASTEEPNDKGKDSPPKSPEVKEDLTMDLEGDLENDEDLDTILNNGLIPQDTEESVDGKTTLSVSAQMTLFLTRLENLANRDLVDQAAVDFCYISNKASCNRLIQNLIQVPANRLDLLSHYSRFIATLHPYFPEISQGVETALCKEFRLLFRKKTSSLDQTRILERRVKNARYLGELTKFGLIPHHFIFFLLKSLLDGFIFPGNAETLCGYFEVCGRYLSKSPETSARTNTMLDIMMKKKTVLHLDERISLMIENAFYQCNPPTQSAIVKRERTPMEQFIRKVLLNDLHSKSLDKVLRILRKLHWDDSEVTYRTLRGVFTKVNKSPFAHLPGLATLLGGLIRYHPDFVVDVIDQVLEDIRVGLEINNYRDCQKRIAQVKYLAELYNYRVIESPVIFDSLYLIMTFGYAPNQMTPGTLSSLDPPDDFFRIRLCCTILDSCGPCFDRGQNKIRLDGILNFLQVYILYKSPIPLDIQFAITDTFELLRPKLVLYTSYDQALQAFDLLRQNNPRFSKELFAPFFQSNIKNEPVSLYPESDSEDCLQTSSGSSDSSNYNSDSKEDNYEDSGDGSRSELGDNSEDDQVVLLNQLNKDEDLAQRQREDEEFEKEYQLMLSSTLEARRVERKSTVLDVPIPMKLLDKQAPLFLDNVGSNVAFTLLTKRGNKQQLKTMAIPSDSNLVINTLNKQRADLVEKQQLKDIVLSLEENFDKEDERDFKSDLAKQGVRVLNPHSRNSQLRPNNKRATTLPAFSSDNNSIKASDFGLKSRVNRHDFKSNPPASNSRPAHNHNPELLEKDLGLGSESFPPLTRTQPASPSQPSSFFPPNQAGSTYKYR